MPTGNPSRVSPMGAVVAGRPVSVAKEIQKSRSRYWRGPSGVARDVVLERRRACRRPDARDLERVLHSARHTVERPPPVTPSARLVGRASSRERGVAGERDDRVEAWVVARDPVEDPRRQLDGGDVATADRADHLERRGEVEVGNGGARGAGGQERRADAREAAAEEGAPGQVSGVQHCVYYPHGACLVNVRSSPGALHAGKSRANRASVSRTMRASRWAASRSSAVVYPHAARKSFAPASASSCFTSSRGRMRSSTNHRRAASPSATSSRRIVRLGRRASLPYT